MFALILFAINLIQTIQNFQLILLTKPNYQDYDRFKFKLAKYFDEDMLFGWMLKRADGWCKSVLKTS